MRINLVLAGPLQYMTGIKDPTNGHMLHRKYYSLVDRYDEQT